MLELDVGFGVVEVVDVDESVLEAEVVVVDDRLDELGRTLLVEVATVLVELDVTRLLEVTELLDVEDTTDELIETTGTKSLV